MIYYTSDTHFNHANILKYTGRPWPDLNAMNAGLIQNWNEVVKPEDTIVHIGDFAMGPKVRHPEFLQALNGYKILVRGNHDQKPEKMLAQGWNEVCTARLETINGLRVYMAHIPMGNDPYQLRETPREYPREFLLDPPEYDIWLCGHVHTSWKRRGNVINVGTDVWGYKPVTFEQLLAAVDEGHLALVPSADAHDHQQHGTEAGSASPVSGVDLGPGDVGLRRYSNPQDS